MSIVASHIDKTLGKAKVLKDVSLAVDAGSIHGLVGENGAGKTTLINIMSGLYRADGGTVTVDGQPVFDDPVTKAHIGVVPSQCTLFQGAKQKSLLRFMKGVYPDFDEALFTTLTDGIDLKHKPIHRLSTGMQMIASIAAILSRHPKVLLLDEPFLGLDVIIKRRIMDLLVSESEKGETAILISSHNLTDLERITDHVTFLVKGEVSATGDVFDVKNSAYQRFQVVFEGNAPDDLIAWEGITDLSLIGRVFTITFEGEAAALEQRLRAHGVILLEPLGTTLEDAFIHDYLRQTQKGGNVK